jgi:hypothetical protein
VEPSIAVDPGHTNHAVAVWQQDRYSGSGARALAFSVSDNAGASWTPPATIPGFDGSVSTSVYQRYSDPWVSIAPDGTVYASALAFSFSAGFATTSAILASTSIDGGHTWSTPATLVVNPVPPGTNPVDLLNDKESVTADPTDSTGKTAYVIWDRLNQPSDNADFNAYHGFAFRGDTLFAKTTDRGATWDTSVLFAPQSNEEWIGHITVVMPTTSAHPGRLVDLFSLEQGSGSQGVKSARDKVAVIYSDDGGATWSGPVIVADQFDLPVSDPDTGAAVRAGEPLPSFAVDPTNGNLYAAWDDARFTKKFSHDSIALSMSTDGGQTWSVPIQVNQTPTDIPDADQQAFIPSVAVAADHTVAVTYYDFRNNTSAAGVPTDYWLVHASGDFANAASWTTDEKRLTSQADGVTGAPFDLENAANTSRGYFLGDYQGLAAAGSSFYALFTQAGSGASDPSNIWFRDPPPARVAAAVALAPVAPARTPADGLAAARDAVVFVFRDGLVPAAVPGTSPATPAVVLAAPRDSAAPQAGLTARAPSSAPTGAIRDEKGDGWPADVLGGMLGGLDDAAAQVPPTDGDDA